MFGLKFNNLSLLKMIMIVIVYYIINVIVIVIYNDHAYINVVVEIVVTLLC